MKDDTRGISAEIDKQTEISDSVKKDSQLRILMSPMP
jgi:hypothetical protein